MIKGRNLRKTFGATSALSLATLLLAGCGQSNDSNASDGENAIEKEKESLVLVVKACKSYELALESTIFTAPPHFRDAIDVARNAQKSAISTGQKESVAAFELKLEEAMKLAENPVGREDRFVELTQNLSRYCEINLLAIRLAE
jgi:hypothetical protein